MPGKKKPSPHLRDESTWLTRYHSASWKTGAHGYSLRHIPCHCNGRLPACLLAHGFSSRLREDFQPFLLTRLTLIPGSLAAVRGVLVPIIAIRFQDELNYAIETAHGQVQMLIIFSKKPVIIIGFFTASDQPLFFSPSLRGVP
jgi:hypothetical protein